MVPLEQFLHETFTLRELRLIANILAYASNDPAGLPAHNLMVVAAKLCEIIGLEASDLNDAIGTYPESGAKD